MKFFAKYFIFNKSVDVNMTGADLQELANSVSWMEYLRASNGRTYYYFFPRSEEYITIVQDILDKYKLCPERHTSHRNLVWQHVVRVRCRGDKQSESIKKIVNNVLEYKKSCAQQDVHTK